MLIFIDFCHFIDHFYNILGHQNAIPGYKYRLFIRNTFNRAQTSVLWLIYTFTYVCIVGGFLLLYIYRLLFIADIYPFQDIFSFRKATLLGIFIPWNMCPPPMLWLVSVNYLVRFSISPIKLGKLTYVPPKVYILPLVLKISFQHLQFSSCLIGLRTSSHCHTSEQGMPSPYEISYICVSKQLFTFLPPFFIYIIYNFEIFISYSFSKLPGQMVFGWEPGLPKS